MMEEFAHGPRADFWCSKCEESGAQAEPVTLPIKAAFCPTCGKKKWLMRIWSGASSMPGVIGADRHAKSRFTATLGKEAVHGSKDAFADQMNQAAALKSAGAQARSREVPALAVPIQQAVGMVGGALGTSRPVPRLGHGALTQAAGPGPASGSKGWTPPKGS